MYLALLDLSSNQIEVKYYFSYVFIKLEKVFFCRKCQCMKLSFIAGKNADVHFFKNVFQYLIKSVTR